MPPLLLLLLALAAPAPETALGPPERIVPLAAEMEHVQGIEIDGGRLWVTWVDRRHHSGRLSEFELATGKLIRSVAIEDGPRFHPSGLAGDGDSLWLALAEYRPASSAVIERRSKRTLALEARWNVDDHIGCVAATGNRVIGANWDARQFYVWDKSGRLVEKRDNPTGIHYQDMKAPGPLVASGVRGSESAIDWLDPADFHLLRRVNAAKTDRGVPLSEEGMALSNGRLYLLPEDAPSRLFVFKLPR
jgi:hypothetical protein